MRSSPCPLLTLSMRAMAWSPAGAAPLPLPQRLLEGLRVDAAHDVEGDGFPAKDPRQPAPLQAEAHVEILPTVCREVLVKESGSQQFLPGEGGVGRRQVGR